MAPASLPTPAPSTEILPGKKGSIGDQQSFALPPAAISRQSSDSPALTSPSPVNSDSSWRPISPKATSTTTTAKSTNAARLKSSATNQATASATQNEYSLPPPPTRSRKIIQMKPRTSLDSADNAAALASALAQAQAPMNPTLAASSQAASQKPAAASGGKRKQSGAGTTAASRKIARKTAHSLIERRRRSKMNEEFGVLKDMIPACRGQEMHKLAILQASIEYMRYLEQCLGELKAAHSKSDTSPSFERLPSIAQLGVRATSGQEMPTTGTFHTMEDEDSDEEMSDAVSPISMTRPQSAAAAPVLSHHSSISPAIPPSTKTSPELVGKLARYGHGYSSAQSSALPSPAFEPQTQASGPAYGMFALTSPPLGPKPDKVECSEKDDHEATAALLMLNTDRRSWSGPRGARGMSVKDLLG